MRCPSAWQPWAEGSLAERALEAVQAIADELPHTPGWLPEVLSAEGAAALRASLAAGGAGQALFYAYLFFTGHGEGHADRARGASSPSCRLAWCYGDAGIAMALRIAARATHDAAWEHAALGVALSAAARAPEASRVADAGLCHDAAGLGQIFGRLFLETGDERFGTAARLWLERVLEYRTPGQGAGGFRSWAAGLSGVKDWRDDRGFLQGAAGVAGSHLPHQRR